MTEVSAAPTIVISQDAGLAVVTVFCYPLLSVDVCLKEED